MAAASVSVEKESRVILTRWVRLIRENEKYYFAKAMDLFSSLPMKHQAGLIKFLGERENQKFWTDNFADDSRYREVMKSILFYYSGRDKVGDPSKERFVKDIAAFIKSKEFKTDAVAEAKAFTEGLEKL